MNKISKFSRKINKNTFKNFSSAVDKNSFYIWSTTANPSIRKEDFTNKMSLSNEPKKIEFFEGKGPVYSYCGPRHSAVITKDGHLYTFGTGNWGILGHNDEKSVPFEKPKLVEYFSEKGIKVTKICLGDFHSIALTDKGEIYTWGFGGEKGFLNFFRRDPGALGHDNWNHYFQPKKVSFFNDNNIKAKDIACGVSHSIVLSVDGKVYGFGNGINGLLGTGKTKDHKSPVELDFFTIIKSEDPLNEVTKIDCADEYSAALTKKGDLYSWGKNHRGQLGVGAGLGGLINENEVYPTLVRKEKPNLNIVDYECGDNGMMIVGDDGIVYKTGWAIDYTMSEYQMSKTIKTKLVFCGNSYYGLVDVNNKFYQWGNLFKNNVTSQFMDMNIVNKDFFEGRNIIRVSGKFRVCGAIVQ